MWGRLGKGAAAIFSGSGRAILRCPMLIGVEMEAGAPQNTGPAKWTSPRLATCRQSGNPCAWPRTSGSHLWHSPSGSPRNAMAVALPAPEASPSRSPANWNLAGTHPPNSCESVRESAASGPTEGSMPRRSRGRSCARQTRANGLDEPRRDLPCRVWVQPSPCPPAPAKHHQTATRSRLVGNFVNDSG